MPVMWPSGPARISGAARPPARLPAARAALGWFAAALVFGLAATQAPLFTGNQHTKFLIGLARAGHGSLAGDWLAHTADPLPAFSALVRWTCALLPQEAFYAYSLILFGVYLYALLGIARGLFGLDRSRPALFLLFGLLVFLHSRLLRRLVIEALGWNAAELLHEGLADQYILSRVFQPCVFGVFLLLSIRVFLRGRPRAAALLLAPAVLFHPGYLLTALALALSYCAPSRHASRSWVRGLEPLALALLPAAPILIYNALALRPASPELWREGVSFLVHERIPHHALPAIWFDRGAVVQAGLIVWAMLIVRRTRLLPVMLIPFSLGTLLTLLQVIAGSDSLALLAPWRVSAFLMPLATVILFARLLAALLGIFARPGGARAAVWLAAGFLVASVLAGARWQVMDLAGRRSRPEAPMLDHVRRTHSPGDVYLVPPMDPAFIGFRLDTGAPVLATWKSHPYRMDDELREWRERIEAGRAIYGASGDSICASADRAAARYGVTHVVTRVGAQDPVCASWTETFRDTAFAVYRVR